MSAFSESRKALAESLEGIGYLVYSYPSETMQVPAIVLVPNNPYLEPVTISRNVYSQNFKVTLMVAMNDNQAALLNLEDLIEKFMEVLPSNIKIDSISQPSVTQVGPSNVLAVDASVYTHLVKE